MVFLAMPVVRTVERIEHPSTRQLTTRIRSSLLSRFILTIMLVREGIVNMQASVFVMFYACILSLENASIEMEVCKHGRT